MSLPDDVEVIIVDDGSKPSLRGYLDNDGYYDDIDFNFSLYETKDFRDWTQPAARNFGVKHAKGEFILVTDIDHIIPRETIEIGRNPTHDVIRFKREVGILDEHGDFTQDLDTLRSWGFNRGRLTVSPHSNSFICRTGLYLGLGGVSERHVGSGKHPNREEIPFKQKLKPLERDGRITIWQDRETKPMLYVMPTGRFCGDKDTNPFGLFHDLKRKNR